MRRFLFSADQKNSLNVYILMNTYRMVVYLDSLRAGHAYFEMLKPNQQEGEVYGFYPAKFDEKREVLFGEGQLRKDRERLEENRNNDDVWQSEKGVDLDSDAYQKALKFLEQQNEQPNYYFLIGYNCIDFIQDLYEAALGAKAGKFVDKYSNDELEKLSWVGTYARLRK